MPDVVCAWIKIPVGDFANRSLHPNGILFVLLNRFICFHCWFSNYHFSGKKNPTTVLADFPLFTFHNFKSFFEDVDKNSCFSIHVITEKASIF